MTDLPVLKKVKRVALTEREVTIVALTLHHLTDYMAGDDREDHGFNKLKNLRLLPLEDKTEYYVLAGRFKRLMRKW